jgi:hypothetical protein
MNALQNVKVVNVTPPAAIKDAASFATTSIDTAGFGKLAVYFSLGATDIAMTALKLQEADDDSSYGDITGASGAPALPTADDDNKVFGFFVNLAGRKRYIDVVATAGDGAAGTFGTCIAVLYNGEGINTATERGLAANLIKD